MQDHSISIVIPTYNERDNIIPLVERLNRTLTGHKYEVLFVDDNSKDGTVDVAAKLAASYPVKVLVRTSERGLATAVLHGLKYASGDIIGVMDADLQHPPEVNAELLKAIENGADMAVASRYVEGVPTGAPAGLSQGSSINSSLFPALQSQGKRPDVRVLYVQAR
jgi:dolichol-phosphate mannosyltransferase